MTSRERVLCALNHDEPDRVPIFFGTSGVTTMNTAAYDRLKTHLGLRTETRSFWRALQYAVLDEEVMARFHSDGRPLIPGPAASTSSRNLAPGGGYILAAVHCIQPDVPPENVCAMFDEAVLAGRYPLTL
jgi:uroporphyrinogen-III decarboxylase